MHINRWIRHLAGHSNDEDDKRQQEVRDDYRSAEDKGVSQLLIAAKALMDADDDNAGSGRPGRGGGSGGR